METLQDVVQVMQQYSIFKFHWFIVIYIDHRFLGFSISHLKLDQGRVRFAEIASELTKAWRSGATEFEVWIGDCNVKVWKPTEDKLHKIWNSKYFSQISAKWAHARYFLP